MSSDSLAAHRPVCGRHAGVAAAILALTLLGWGVRPAQATDGYFMTGAGVQSKGLAGAGTAWGNDPLAAMANPALGLQIGNAVGGNLEIFNPDRDATVGGVEFESSHEIFALPALGYNKMLGKRSSIGKKIPGGAEFRQYDKVGIRRGEFALDRGEIRVHLEQRGLELQSGDTHGKDAPLAAIRRMVAVETWFVV